MHTAQIFKSISSPPQTSVREKLLDNASNAIGSTSVIDMFLFDVARQRHSMARFDCNLCPLDAGERLLYSIDCLSRAPICA